MLIIHHLGVSQSDRVVWLMEELGLPYEIVWHDRGADGLAPASYLSLHPAATAPVVQDGDRVLCESAAILEYVCHKYAGGALTVPPDRQNYPDYVYWMHFNNNIIGLFFARMAMGEQSGLMAGLIARREEGYARFLEQTLAATPHLAGPEFSCADVMAMFSLTSPLILGSRSDLPHTRAYVARISQRPAYMRAMQIAGPTAKPPTRS